MFKVLLINVIFFNLLFLNSFAFADTLPQSELIAFENWKQQTLKQEALKKGISAQFIHVLLPRLKYLPEVLKADKKQSEFLLTFWRYTDKVITQKRIQEGKENAKKYHTLLKQVSEKYNVHQKYILAFWGLETNYGARKGDFDTLSALATLSFDKRRRAFFTNELLTLLKLIQNGEKTHFKGSWAGAFGQFQFMPTTYAAYAVDATGDGKKDIINSLPDAFESAANYLHQMGWKSNQLWGKEVKFTQKIDWETIPENNKMTIQEWQKKGVLPACGENGSDEELNETARLVMPSGIDGPAFLTFKNYDYITRWNNSTLYALSIGILADSIENNDVHLCTKRSDSLISRADIRFIQTQLSKQGFYTDTVDGIWGCHTKKAIQAYQKANHLDADGFPSLKLIQHLKENQK